MDVHGVEKIPCAGEGIWINATACYPPAEVTEKDSKSQFQNGVLEVRLDKTKISPKSRIEIE